MHFSLTYDRIFKNMLRFSQFVKEGYDYILNPAQGELHRAVGGSLLGNHNLVHANLDNFIGLYNLQVPPIHLKFDGTLIPIFDESTGRLIEFYRLNKCRYCFPHLR